MKIVCIIPARVNSQRFHKKIFAQLGDKTLLGTTIEAAKKVSLFDEVIVAGCTQEVVDLAHAHGVKGVVTDPLLPNGTLRMIAAIETLGITAEYFVNWQADEPFINEEVIMNLMSGGSNCDIWTLKKEIDRKEGEEPSVVKVVTDIEGKALYFSRSLIPYERGDGAKYFKHIGLYAFTKSALERIKGLQKSFLEGVEVLEQLRWLEHGLTIKVSVTYVNLMGIDTEKDLFVAHTFKSTIKS